MDKLVEKSVYPIVTLRVPQRRSLIPPPLSPPSVCSVTTRVTGGRQLFDCNYFVRVRRRFSDTVPL